MIGQALTKALITKGYHVIILTRNVTGTKPQPDLSYAQWNPKAQTYDRAAFQEADAIIHLAGANVADGRWTKKRKQEIVDSRVQSGALLVKALRETENKVTTVVSSSGIGWYGSDPQVPNSHAFTENDPAAKDFLGTTCLQWEQSIQPVTALQKRLVIFRTGLVFSNEGGAYAEFKKPMRFGAATILGSGTQIVSWIHIDDIVNLYITALENSSWSGVYNAVAPQPVSNETLIKSVAKQHGGFHVTMHVPELALKTALGEMSVEVLKSATVSSKKLQDAGYTFLFDTIDKAVHQLEASNT